MQSHRLSFDELTADERAVLAAYLAARAVRDSTTGCLRWRGTVQRAYGMVHWRGRAYRAHRVAYALARGTLEAGELVRHRCPHGPDPLCIEPTHLEPGDDAQNVADRHAAGRDVRGEAHWAAKLTEQQVREMRRLRREFGWTCAQLADRFGIDASSAAAIIRRQRWAHVVDTSASELLIDPPMPEPLALAA